MFKFVVTESERSDYRAKSDKSLLSDEETKRCKIYHALPDTLTASFDNEQEAIQHYKEALERIDERHTGFVSFQILEEANQTITEALTLLSLLFVCFAVSFALSAFLPLIIWAVFVFLVLKTEKQTPAPAQDHSVVVSFAYCLNDRSPTARVRKDFLQYCVFTSEQVVDANRWDSGEGVCQKFTTAKEAMEAYRNAERRYEENELALVSLQINAGIKILRTYDYGTERVTLYQRRRVGTKYASVTEEDWRNNALSKFKWADDIARRDFLLPAGTDVRLKFSPQCARYNRSECKKDDNDESEEYAFDLFD